MSDRPTKLEPAELNFGNDYPRSPCCDQVIMGNSTDGFSCFHCGKEYTLYYREK